MSVRCPGSGVGTIHQTLGPVYGQNQINNRKHSKPYMMIKFFFGKTLAVFLAAAVASLLATTGAVSPAAADSAHVLTSPLTENLIVAARPPMVELCREICRGETTTTDEERMRCLRGCLYGSGS